MESSSMGADIATKQMDSFAAMEFAQKPRRKKIKQQQEIINYLKETLSWYATELNGFRAKRVLRELEAGDGPCGGTAKTTSKRVPHESRQNVQKDNRA